MIRKILLPVRGDGKGANALAHAAALAERSCAHILVTHCRARPEDLLPFGVPVPSYVRQQLLKQSYELADLEEAGLRDELAIQAEKLNLRLTESPDFSAPSAQFIEQAGRQVDVIKIHGRLADVIVVPQPDRDRNIGTNTMKAALFHTGRPVLMCPPAETPPSRLGDHVAIAWNGSMEAARAVALTLPLLETAGRVTILCAGKAEIHGATADDLTTYLAMREISSETLRFDAKRVVAQRLLEQSNEVGADVLVMGAYGDSHERETLFGGNTQTVVDTAEMPVLMVH